MTLEETNEVIRSLQKTAPVNVHKLAEKLELEVYTTTLFPKNVSGAIIKNKETNRYRIITNEKQSSVRQRFTIAHEIAHFLLHKDLIGDGIQEDTLYRSGLSEQREVEANQFAANILMPWHLIEAALDEGAESTEQLANKLDVSKSAISIRIGIP